METAAKPSTLRSILQQRCPRCRIGESFIIPLFRGFRNRASAAPSVTSGSRGNRATSRRYVLQVRDGVSGDGANGGVAVGLDGMVDHEVIVCSAALFLPFAPTITLFARVLWIYFDQTIDPKPAREPHLRLLRKPGGRYSLLIIVQEDSLVGS